MEEVWKDIIEEGFEGLYQCSNLNSIRSLDRWVVDTKGRKYFVKGKILKQQIGKHGYSMVCLSNEGKKKRCYTHRLIFEAFFGKIPEGYQVNHKDENKQNNVLSNIDTLMSPKQNINWGTHNERMSKTKRLKWADRVSNIVQKTLQGEIIKIWPSQNEIQRQLGYAQQNISICCRGGHYLKGKWVNCTQAYGYIWQYTDKAAS